MPGVSVSAQAVAGAISLCKQSIQSFTNTSKSLGNKYQAAGTGWADSKYAQLGAVVKDCQTALNKPVKELEDCIKKLEALQKAITEYEQTSV